MKEIVIPPKYIVTMSDELSHWNGYPVYRIYVNGVALGFSSFEESFERNTMFYVGWYDSHM
jgi:hypothetical protein